MAAIYNTAGFDPRTSVGALVSRVRNVFYSSMDDALATFDLNTLQYVVIVLLANGIVEKPSDICSMISHDPGAMSRLLDRLAEKNLVRRIPAPDDRRAVRLELTDQGRAIYPRITELAVEVANRLLNGFSTAEARQLEGLLGRILTNAGLPALPCGPADVRTARS